jgi:hypothetical protein
MESLKMIKGNEDNRSYISSDKKKSMVMAQLEGI